MSDLLLNLILGKVTPAKGEIYINGIRNFDYIKKNIQNIGIIFREDSLYEKETAGGYLKFFKNLLNSNADYEDIMLKVGLLDLKDIKIKKLNYSQKRRLSLAREMLKQPKLLIFQEPILNMDIDGAKIIAQNIEEMVLNGASALITSVFFKDAIMLGEKSYRLDENGLVQLEDKKQDKLSDSEESLEQRPVYKIEKIPAKVDERMILFDPTEIDYIESSEGISSLSIRGEKFPCSLSLTELEKRLKYFGFFRCHRSYIVNLQKVREVITWTRNSYSLNLDDKVKSSIPLSKGRLEELKNILKL